MLFLYICIIGIVHAEEAVINLISLQSERRRWQSKRNWRSKRNCPDALGYGSVKTKDELAVLLGEALLFIAVPIVEILQKPKPNRLILWVMKSALRNSSYIQITKDLYIYTVLYLAFELREFLISSCDIKGIDVWSGRLAFKADMIASDAAVTACSVLGVASKMSEQDRLSFGKKAIEAITRDSLDSKKDLGSVLERILRVEGVMLNKKALNAFWATISMWPLSCIEPWAFAQRWKFLSAPNSEIDITTDQYRLCEMPLSHRIFWLVLFGGILVIGTWWSNNFAGGFSCGLFFSAMFLYWHVEINHGQTPALVIVVVGLLKKTRIPIISLNSRTFPSNGVCWFFIFFWSSFILGGWVLGNFFGGFVWGALLGSYLYIASIMTNKKVEVESDESFSIQARNLKSEFELMRKSGEESYRARISQLKFRLFGNAWNSNKINRDAPTGQARKEKSGVLLSKIQQLRLDEVMEKILAPGQQEVPPEKSSAPFSAVDEKQKNLDQRAKGLVFAARVLIGSLHPKLNIQYPELLTLPQEKDLVYFATVAFVYTACRVLDFDVEEPMRAGLEKIIRDELNERPYPPGAMNPADEFLSIHKFFSKELLEEPSRNARRESVSDIAGKWVVLRLTDETSLNERGAEIAKAFSDVFLRETTGYWN